MPLRETKRVPRPPGQRESWLRRIFVEDWNLKLLAMAITLVLWFLVSGRVVEREVSVEPKIQGKPAAMFEVKEVSARPARVALQGPVDRLNAIDKAETQPISVEGRRESFDVPNVRLELPNSRIEPLGRVDVHVTIVATANSQPKSQGSN